MSRPRCSHLALALGVLLLAACVPAPGLVGTPASAFTPTREGFLTLQTKHIQSARQTQTAVWAGRGVETATARAIWEMTATAMPSPTATPPVTAAQGPKPSVTPRPSSDDLTSTAVSATAAVRATQVVTIQAAMQTAQPNLPDALPTGSMFQWPMQPFTKDQLAEARACQIETMRMARYPTVLRADELASAASAVSPCDYAVLASAYAERYQRSDTMPENWQTAYYSAVLLNPAYTITSPLYYGYFGGVSLTDPPLAGRVVKTAVVTYSRLNGRNKSLAPGAITLLVTSADTQPVYHGSIYTQIDLESSLRGAEAYFSSQTLTGTASAANVQALLGALTNLVPVSYEIWGDDFVDACKGDPSVYIGVQLFLDDNTMVNLQTSGRTYIRGGGPWVMDIDGQKYLQTGPDLARAFGPLAVELQLSAAPPDLTLAPSTDCDVIHRDMLSWLYHDEDN